MHFYSYCLEIKRHYNWIAPVGYNDTLFITADKDEFLKKLPEAIEKYGDKENQRLLVCGMCLKELREIFPDAAVLYR